MKTENNDEGLQELSNMLDAITKYCKGDGSGLSAGTMRDMVISEYLKKKSRQFTECHTGECDMKINDIPISLKTITGKSEIALDWSKNPTIGEREYFTCGIMIINLKQEQWWKNTPKLKKSKIKITYNHAIPAGIYLIDKQFCKYNIKLSSNNKTNTLIDNQHLYIMIKRSISLNLFTPLPSPNKELRFNILNAFL